MHHKLRGRASPCVYGYVVCCCKLNNTRDCDEHFSDKLAHVQVVKNCQKTDAPMCTREDPLAYISEAPSIDDVMSYNLLTTVI